MATQPDRADWILPIVIGGDDLTAIMDGRVAFGVTAAFLRRFEHHSAEHPVVREVVAAVTTKLAPDEPHPVGLTASAGIAYVKPHHPFSDGYELAAQLCGAVKKVDRQLSALDFHVLHDSVGRDRGQLRVPVDDDGLLLRLWSGPVVVSGHGDGPPSAGAHHVTRLRAAMDGQQQLGSGAVHQLRDALLVGGAAIDRAAAQVRNWAEDRTQANAYLDAHLRSVSPNPRSGSAGCSMR